MRRVLFYIFILLCLASCEERTYRIGVSQCGGDDWHALMNTDLKREANSHPEVELIFSDASMKTEEQIENLEKLFDENIDLLIVSPNDADALVPVIEKFHDSGIPVILVDRTIHSPKYTASVSCDNEEIGEVVGSFVAASLAGKGRILEIQGSAMASTAQERHRGLLSVLQKFPDIHLVASAFADWDYNLALTVSDSLLRLYPDVEMIVAQNDDMAQAARETCVRLGIDPLPKIVGVDGLPGPDQGIDNVASGKQTATCLNPSGATEAFALALDILMRHTFPRHTRLSTFLIDEHNVSFIAMQRQIYVAYNKKIEDINGELGAYWRRNRLLNVLLIACVIIFALIVTIILVVNRMRHTQMRLRDQVDQADKNKLSFFTNVSHSFRTPLTLIANPLHQLKQEGGLNERQTELLSIMEKNTDHLLDLTSQVLSVMKSDPSDSASKVDELAQNAYERSQRNAEFCNTRLRGTDPQPDALDEINRKTILVIDDNADIRQYLSLLLGSRYIVLTASNGEEGLLEARQNIPDLIICDVLMPVMDGLECCSQLKKDEITSHIPVLMLSAYALDDQRIEGYKSGADAYMTKPFSSDVLMARIRNLLLSRRHIDTGKENTQEQMKQAEFSSVDTSFVTRLQDFIMTNMANSDLTINDLCGEMHMSRVQLYRKCKSLTDVSPVELVRNLRLQQAKHLLESSQLSVSEIAYEVGFSSPSYFAKCYRDQYGVSPTGSKK